MTRKMLLLTIAAALSLSILGFNSAPGFSKLLKQAKMSFELPEGFHKVRLVKNNQMSYEYAMQDSSGELEVRYTIRPIDMEDARQGGMDFDNELTNLTIFCSIIFNISDQKLQMPELMSRIRKMPPEKVAAEFQGDDGICSLVHLGREFGQDYKYGFVMNLHKKQTANAFIYFLGKDSTLLSRITPAMTHALKFN